MVDADARAAEDRARVTSIACQIRCSLPAATPALGPLEPPNRCDQPQRRRAHALRSDCCRRGRAIASPLRQRTAGERPGDNTIAYAACAGELPFAHRKRRASSCGVVEGRLGNSLYETHPWPDSRARGFPCSKPVPEINVALLRRSMGFETPRLCWSSRPRARRKRHTERESASQRSLTRRAQPLF
jgi:hypothetical protein